MTPASKNKIDAAIARTSVCDAKKAVFAFNKSCSACKGGRLEIYCTAWFSDPLVFSKSVDNGSIAEDRAFMYE